MKIELSGYTLGNLVDHSGHVLIYEVIRNSDQQKFVIKTLAKRHPSAREISTIRREFEITRRLSEIDHVIKFIELIELGDGNLVIVMERFEQSLESRILESKTIPLSVSKVLEVAIKLVNTAGKVHSQGIVHKDIAPRNIVCSKDLSSIRLIDFSISSELFLEHQDTNITERLVGSLPYLSPEQTGRMNRDLDYRSDYYSIGVTLFEMLTGRLPYEAKSVLEWIHAHISKLPLVATDLDSRIPNMVSKIILKLMSKDPQERYQSSIGILHDLVLCKQEIDATNSVREFQLAEKDISQTFSIPQRLYGREKEVATLTNSFEMAANGSLEICLISGFSGVGKSSLVNELSKSVVHNHGSFLLGKFDQFQRSTPYSAITKAFESLARQLLTLPSNELKEWRQKILEALGPNAQIIVELIPNLEAIIGKQPAVISLAPAESQNRLQLAFQSFVKCLASAEHPLILFIDDLQWADAPTLSLIQKIVTSREIEHLMFIGAYRENEVGVGHPLLLACDEIKKTQAIFEIEVAPLHRSTVGELIAETLHADKAYCEPLVDILFRKSEGNPFYLNEMLKLLNQEGHLSLNPENGTWEYDEAVVRKANFGDSAVELTLSNLKKLPSDTQNVLAKAACIGDHFNLNLLSIIHEKNRVETSRDLQGALTSGLIIPQDADYKFVGDEIENLTHEALGEENSDPEYKFQHDRVQQAAYALIQEPDKHQLHLKIGRRLQSYYNEKIPDDKLIDIVNHLNFGRSLLKDEKEKLALSKLNLTAGIKARDSSAYLIALNNFEIGIELLPKNAWKNHYDLLRSLYTEHMRCSYLTGKLEDAENSADIIFSNVKSDLERAEILSMRTRQYATIGRMEDSIIAAIKGLKLLGIDFSENPSDKDLKREIKNVSRNLNGREISSLLNAKKMEDREKIIAIELLMEIFPAAFLSASGTIFPYLVLKSVNLCLEHGNCSQTAFAYAAYGMLLCGVLEDPKTGYEYGKLAIAMNEKFDDVQLKARVIYVYAMFIHHWSNHWSSLTKWFLKGIDAGYKSGDLLYLAYSAQDCIIWDPALDLETASKKQREYLKLVRDCEYQDSYDSGTLFLQMQLNFQGQTHSKYSLSDDLFDEASCLEGMHARKFMTGVANYNIYKLEIHYLYGDYENALDYVFKQDELVNSSMSLPQLVRFKFISFLTLAQSYALVTKSGQEKILKRLNQDHTQMKNWAQNCPENFSHLQTAMEAELARISGKFLQAAQLFTSSVALAQKNRFYRDQAMILELTGKLFIEQGFANAATGYLQESRRVFARWGAHSKVVDMQETYTELFATNEGNKHKSLTTSKTGSGTYDQGLINLESIMKASQAISGEVVLSKLYEVIMDILLENAGAQIGYFLQSKDDKLYLLAANGDHNSELFDDLSLPLSESSKSPAVPFSIIHYAIRSGQHVVLDNASVSPEFNSDPYLK